VQNFLPLSHKAPRPRRAPALRRVLAWASLGSALLLGACATPGAPTEQMAVSTAAVANAVSAGSPEWAAAEMRSAREKLDQANAAMAAKDYGRARMLAHEVQADALLATAKARASKAQKAADVMQEDNRVLREELSRKAATPAPPAAATPAIPSPIPRN
jgi:Domain of unknown function (DUF4398)